MEPIDLHMHTKYSDGEHTLLEVLKIAEQRNVKTIAITDHNSVGAFYELKENDYSNVYSGKIIKGTEINSFYNGRVVEFLVYDYDLDKMNNFINSRYGDDWARNKVNMVLTHIKNVAKSKGMIFDPDFNITGRVGESSLFFRHLLTFEENKKFFSKELIENTRLFFRKEICNPESDFYIDYGNFFLKPKEIIDFVKQNGGKVFLAHLFEYEFEKPMELLNYVRDLGVDGIECYHPCFTSKEQCLLTLDFAKKNNLLVCGGSDFHGSSRPNQIGILNSTIEIDINNFDWVKNTQDVNKH